MKSFCLRSISEGLLGVVMLLVFPAQALPATVTLAWDANAEQNIAGYEVYYQKWSSGPPFDYFGYVALQDLADPGNPSATITDLEDDTDYYFVITAVNTEGIESAFSNSTCAEIGAGTGQPCGAGDAAPSDNGGGGGGGGGGCFLNALGK
jgi:hypothetical protein